MLSVIIIETSQVYYAMKNSMSHYFRIKDIRNQICCKTNTIEVNLKMLRNWFGFVIDARHNPYYEMSNPQEEVEPMQISEKGMQMSRKRLSWDNSISDNTFSDNSLKLSSSS